MSYVRFGTDGSDIYLFAHYAGFVQCCGCLLRPATYDEESENLHDADAVVEHLRLHVAAGHTVKEKLLDPGFYPDDDFVSFRSSGLPETPKITASADRLGFPADLGTPSEVADLCARFLATDPDAQGWSSLFPDESDWESPDCDVMSARFLDFVQAEGFDGFLVQADSVDEGQHWFTVIQAEQSVAVDWTARQFHNGGFPAPPTDPTLIPCPLVFGWPGRYPLEVVEFQTMVRS